MKPTQSHETTPSQKSPQRALVETVHGECLINARPEKRVAGALADDNTHEACASVADVNVGVLLCGREGEVVTRAELGIAVFLFDADGSLGDEEHLRPPQRIRLRVVAVTGFERPSPQLGILGSGNGCEQYRDTAWPVSSPRNFADLCVRCGRGGNEVDECDTQRVGEMIKACQADVRVPRLELDDSTTTDTCAIRQCDLAEVSCHTKATHVRTDVR